MPKKNLSLKPQGRPRRAGASESRPQAAPTTLKAWTNTKQASLYQAHGPFTRLIGREQETRALNDLLQRPEVRLVTLSGTAGVGKTRLAWQAIGDLQEVSPASCHFVSLASVYAVELIVPTIIQTLGLPRAENRSPFEHLVAFLQDQQAILVLDNFEQLADAAPMLAELLSGCPGVKLLVTSRAILRVQGEYEFRVPPLALPDLAHLPDCEQLVQYPAIALFIERAQAAQQTFQFNETTARPVAEICARLDGLPLAIELAAARSKIFAPDALLRRLEHRLEVLTGGGPDLPERQQTLRATIIWSYDLLAPEAQWLFRQLAVFVGGGKLEAIEALCATLEGFTTPVLDVVTALLNQSLLIQSGESDGEPRFSLFETLREYGLDCLDAEGELEQARQAHAAYYQALVQEAGPSLFGFPPISWLNCIERDYGNVRVALEYLLAHTQAEAALRLAGILGNFWFFRGYLSEGRQFLAQALAIATRALVPKASKVRAHALHMAGWLALWQLDFSQAAQHLAEGFRAFLALHDPAGQAAVLNLLSTVEDARGNTMVAEEMSQEALEICQELGEQRGLADVLLMRGMQALFQGAFALTQRFCSESLAIFEQLGDSWGVATNLHYLGWAAYCQGDVPGARRQTEASVARFRTFGIPSLTVEAITMLGYEVAAQGDDTMAASLFEDAMVLGRAVGNPITIARVLCGQGHLAFHQEQANKAQTLFEKSILCLKGMDKFARTRWVLASCLEGIAEIAWTQQQTAWAARLLSSATARCTTKDSATFLGAIHPHSGRILANIRAEFHTAAFAHLWAEGQTMAIEQLLGPEGQAPLDKEAAQPTHNNLTTREMEVLTLITKGLSNKKIAEYLVLSPNTINIHVQAIYRKLEVSSRAAATRYAIEHHLIFGEDPK